MCNRRRSERGEGSNRKEKKPSSITQSAIDIFKVVGVLLQGFEYASNRDPIPGNRIIVWRAITNTGGRSAAALHKKLSSSTPYQGGRRSSLGHLIVFPLTVRSKRVNTVGLRKMKVKIPLLLESRRHLCRMKCVIIQ